LLFLIGLQSGKGLHPDRIFKLPEFQNCQRSPKFGSADQFLVPPKLPEVKVLNFHFLAILATVLSLPLFVFRILANHPHHTFAVHDLALVTNLLY
jgi:hypothetical protein